MNRNGIITPSFVLYAGLVLATLGGLMTEDPRIWGFFLIGWAFFALYLIHKIMGSNRGQASQVYPHKPVARLLAGVVRKSRDSELKMKEAGTRMSVGILGLSGLFFSVEILLDSNGYGLYQNIAFICLCGLLFWITQSLLCHQKAAYMMMAMFAGIGLFFVPQIWDALMVFVVREDTYAVYFGGYALIGVTAFVFMRALCVRHRGHEFAMAGLIASGVLFCILASGAGAQSYPVLFLLWGIVSVAWTQSRPKSKVRQALYPKNAMSLYKA